MKRRRPSGEAAPPSLGTALANLLMIAQDLHALTESMAKQWGAARDEGQRYLWLYELSALKLACFVEALKCAFTEIRKTPEGPGHLRRLSAITSDYMKAEKAIFEFRSQVVAHGTPDMGLDHQAVRIARLSAAIPFDRWVFLCRLSLSATWLLIQPYGKQCDAAFASYCEQYEQSKGAALKRIGGRADLAHIDLEIAALSAQVQSVSRPPSPASLGE